MKLNTEKLEALAKEKNINIDSLLNINNINQIDSIQLYDICSQLGVTPSEIMDEKEHKIIDIKDYESHNPFISVKNINKPQKKYNVLEVFAGAGGLMLGLEKAGFNTVGAIEIDKHACATLRTNRKNLNVIEGDIEEIVKNGIRNYIGNTNVDVLSGGYPCQAFSFAGKKLGLNDTRGTMFYWYAQLLHDLQPKMFLAENVRGLVSHEKGATLKGMIEVFDEVGYDVTYKVLKATDYNVAQKRERIFIIGIRKDLKNGEFRYPEPFDYKPVLRDVLKNVPESPGKKYPPRKKEIMDMVPPGGYWRDLPLEIQKEYMKGSFYLGGGKTGMARRMSWDEPSLTLTTAPDMKQTERCHPVETRPFTVREYARIQSFPDSWKFEGPITAQYKQIGNAVPVELAKCVGLSMLYYLQNMDNMDRYPEDPTNRSKKSDLQLNMFEFV